MPQQPLSNIKALSLMHFSLLFGQVIFAGVAAYLIYTGAFTPVIENKEILSMVVPGAIGWSVAFVMLAFSNYKKKVAAIRMNEESLSDKLIAYRAANIVRWAILEVPVLSTIVCFLMTGLPVLIFSVASFLLIFLYAKPSAYKVAQELSISEADVV